MSSQDNPVRKHAVAGGFYPRDPLLLRREIERSFSLGYGPYERPKNGLPLAGAVAPHAGYTYSGTVASFSYGFLASRTNPETIIIVGPNHTGYGSSVSVWPKGRWETPLGSLSVDHEIAAALLSSFPDFDPLSHEFEHSIEVQLPFIQHVFGFEVKIVPVCVLDQSLETSISLGDAIAGSVKNRRVAIVASSDFSHYVPHIVAKQNDLAVIDAILEMNEEKIMAEADRLDVNACGLGPIVAVTHALKKLGVKRTELLKYSTSGEVTGDYNSVVGYASIVFY